MTTALTFSWIVTVKETVLSTLRVYAETSDEALANWQSGEYVFKPDHRLKAEALTATPEQPVLPPLEALTLCLERLELNNIDGSEDSTIDMAKTAIAYATRGAQRALPSIASRSPSPWSKAPGSKRHQKRMH
jgi:hypothetical protein